MNLAALFESPGDPADVLKLVDRPIPQPEMGEVLIRMLLAPVNPADLNTIEGTYGIKPPLPATPGHEGVGRVESVGPGCTLAPGSLVKPPAGSGSWQQWISCPAGECLIFPPGLTPEQAAMLYVNPATAWRMLHDFCQLKPGEWIIQNASNSAVGRCVIQIAKALGLKTINMVRRPELFSDLEDLGADAVFLDEPASVPSIKTLCGDHLPRLAFNAVGGDSVTTLTKCLASGGKVITYGGMSRQPLRLSTGVLIFKDISYHGFWVSKWYEQASQQQLDAMFGELSKLCSAGHLRIAIAGTYPLEKVVEAVQAAQQESRNGKILLSLE